MQKELRRAIFYLTNKIVLSEEDFGSPTKNVLNSAIQSFVKAGVKFPQELFGVRDGVLTSVSEIILSYYGANRDWERTFYTLRQTLETSDCQRIIDQLIHYMTSYWLNLRETNPDKVYLPRKDEYTKLSQLIYVEQDENLLKEIEIMQLSDFIPYFTENFLYAARPFSEDAMQQIIQVTGGLNLSVTLSKIKNNELFIRFLDTYDNLDYSKVRPDNILRYCIYRAFNGTFSLLIKNSLVKKTLKEWNPSPAYKQHIKNMLRGTDFTQLVYSYRRHKELWEIVFRRIRLHGKALYRRIVSAKVPPRQKSTTEILRELTYWTRIGLGSLFTHLKEAPFTELIRIYNAFNYRGRDEYFVIDDERDKPLEVYYIRNGKKCTRETRPGYFSSFYKEALEKYIIPEIRRRLLKVTPLGKVYINPTITGYKIPIATRTDISPTIPPKFSVIECGKASDSGIVFGIHWYDNDNSSVDLDLSAIGVDLESKKKITISWNTHWKDTFDKVIVFSGDMTSAPRPHGAAELIFAKGTNFIVNLQVRDYSCRGVNDAHLIITQSSEELYKWIQEGGKQSTHTVSPNNVLISVPFKMSSADHMLNVGFLLAPNKFIFFPMIGKGGIVASREIMYILAELEFVVNRAETDFSIMDFFKMLQEIDKCEIVDEEDNADIVLEVSNWNTIDFKANYIDVL